MFGTDFALALTALGALAAIVIPFGIWYFTREARYQIDILLEKEVFLLNQVARDLNNIRILIDGNPASEQVVWITGWIINYGAACKILIDSERRKNTQASNDVRARQLVRF